MLVLLLLLPEGPERRTTCLMCFVSCTAEAVLPGSVKTVQLSVVLLLFCAVAV